MLKFITKSKEVALMKAAKSGDVDRTRELLTKGADPNYLIVKDGTALSCAAEEGHMEIVQLLLDSKANVNKEDKGGSTPLIDAARMGHIEIVKLLLDSGADINKADKDGCSPLMAAIPMGLIRPSNCETTEVLIQRGADVNHIDLDGMTPLMVATKIFVSRSAKFLIENDACVDARNNEGLTALMFAVRQDSQIITELLIKNGANTNAASNAGKTPLMHAAESGQNGQCKNIELLLKNNAAADMIDVDGYTPLAYAAGFGNERAVKTMLSYKVPVDQMAVKLATEQNHFNILKLLSGAMQVCVPLVTEKKSKTTAEIRGGFGEPYCSQECYDKGGEYISAVMLKKQTGTCGFCQKTVEASMHGKSNCAVVPYEGVNLFICNKCTTEGKNHLHDYQNCCMCENEL